MNTVSAEKTYELSAEESKTITYYKGILCLMVVMIHAYCLDIHFKDENFTVTPPAWIKYLITLNSHVICQCAVPAFFVISAFLLYRKPFRWQCNLRKKMRTLGIPYVLVNTFWLMFYFILQHIPRLSGLFSDPNKLLSNWNWTDYLNAYLGFKTTQMVYPPYWFIRDLIVLNILGGGIKWLIDRFPRLIAVLLVAGMIFGINTHVFFLNYSSVFWFSIGYYIVKFDSHFERFIDTRTRKILLVLIYIVTINLALFTMESAAGKALMFAANFCGILVWYLLVYSLLSFFNRRKAFRVISHYNFMIYSFHALLLSLCLKVWTVAFKPTTGIGIFAEYFVVPAIIVSCCIAVSYFVERYLPVLYRLLNGQLAKK